MNKKSLHKKSTLFLALILALGGAMYLNWYFTKPTNEQISIQEETVTQEEHLGEAQYVNAEQKNSFFDEANLNRAKKHAQAQEVLQKIIDNTESKPEEKQKAMEKLTEMADNIKLESDIENLITAKTGGKCIAIIDDSVEIIIEKNILNPETTLKIKEIIVSKTKISNEKITLVEVK